MKRFYKQAAVVSTDRGFLVELDGRALKTPEKRLNISPTRSLATAICREWNGQGDRVNPDSMPMAKLQNTALDRVETRRGDLIGELVKYADTDLLCYRADYPQDLARRQETLWQPLLDWVSDRHGVTLKVTTGILHLAQEAAQLARLEQYLQGVDSFRLAAFYNITTLCGSVSVALNVLGGNISADGAWEAAQLDENYQIENWGNDDEAAHRLNNMKAELDAAIRFLDLL